MPLKQLCHTCHVRRLALMQSSQYSVYDEYYKEQLEYVYSQCNLTGPTDILESFDTAEPAPPSFCLSDMRYTTKEGDTCESISKSTSVSSATLYMGNQNLLKDCSSVTPGLSICLPVTCTTHYLQKSETCFSIEMSLGLEFGAVQRFNSWLDMYCTNLHSATGWYGKLICVSPQGGAFPTLDRPLVPDLTPGRADGYTRANTVPPKGVNVAEGTTMRCGKWHVVAASDTCVKICLTNLIETGLFHEVNPSLATGSDCDASLKEKTALCTGPTYMWKMDVRRTSDPLPSTSYT
jgi:LysM repeat protein